MCETKHIGLHLEIVPIVLLANLFLGIYFNLAIWYKLTDKTRFGMYFSIAGAVITIVLNVILLPKYGFIAAAWTTLDSLCNNDDDVLCIRTKTL